MAAAAAAAAFHRRSSGIKRDGTLFSPYKWPSVQVLHLIHPQSQTADRPRTESLPSDS